MDYLAPTVTGPRFSGYLDFLRAEHEQILITKWCESERLGHDCGMDYAVWCWSFRHRAAWIESLRAAGAYPVT